MTPIPSKPCVKPFMPISANQQTIPGVGLAVAAESLYLLNLLLLPGLGFVLLLLLYLKTFKQAPVLAQAHLSQTLIASLWGGFLLLVINALILLLGGYSGMYLWVIIILYFTLVHASFVLLGALGLARALSAQCWRYPVVGSRLPDGCEPKP